MIKKSSYKVGVGTTQRITGAKTLHDLAKGGSKQREVTINAITRHKHVYEVLTHDKGLTIDEIVQKSFVAKSYVYAAISRLRSHYMTDIVIKEKKYYLVLPKTKLNYPF